MAEVSRRLFLFGMAATVAAASVPLALAQPETIIQPVIVPLRFKRRTITDLVMEAREDIKNYPGGRAVLAKVMRGDTVILQLAINSLGGLYWTSGGNPMMSIVDLQEPPISVSFEPDVVPGMVAIDAKYRFDDGQSMFLREEHHFNNGQHSTELLASNVIDQEELIRRINSSG